MDCMLVNLKNVGQPFFKIDISLYQNVIYAARKLIGLSCSLAIILQMIDSCPVSLTFRTHNWQN